MAGLNPHQHKAVHTLSGPLLVLAGAGSGKTRVITFRIVELIQSGIAPSRILAVTFTNKAAKEMKHRAGELLGKRRKKGENPEISTFHSLCVRILRRHIHRLGYPKDFPIYDSGDQEGLARQALRDIRVGHEKLRPGDLMSHIGGWKSQGIRPPKAIELAQGDREQLAAHAYVKYQEALKASGAVDFDDILLCTEELFETFPEVRFAESSRFDHLLIDEYQDTNGLQYRIVKALAERHRNICVVGDDDQSIYGWRGAEVTHILNFANDWPDATVVRLEDNYRSREAILQLANTLIRNNSTRHQKVLRAARTGGEPPRVCRFEDETAEAEAIVREIALLVQNENSEERVKPSDIAILFRTNEQPRAFEVELRRYKIPYVMVGGMSFYDRKEVRDVLAYLRVLAQPRDEVSLLRIINTPPRGIGTQTVQSMLSIAVSKGLPLWEVLPEAKANGDIPDATGNRIEEFRLYLESLRDRLTKEPITKVVREMLDHVAYKKELERVYKTGSEVDARWACVEELVNSIAIYEERTAEPSLSGFLDETTLGGREDGRDEKGKKQEHAVTLMTLHSAKGLEFPRVYMVGMEEGILPHQRSLLAGSASIAEERRLAYVGVTRAQDFLTLSLAKQRMKWGKPRPTIVSRFLLEMRGENEKAAKAAAAAEQTLVLAAPKEPDPAGKAASKPKKAATRAAGSSAATPGRAARGTASSSRGAAAKPSRSASKQAAVGRAARPTTPKR
jgi:DNA helicase-2/ATP-dependent DNA helicase PcrA